MPRRSKLTNTQITQMQSQSFETVADGSSKIVKLVFEEGLWVVLVVDLLLVSDELNPRNPAHKFLIAQRQAIGATIRTISSDKFELVPGLKFPNPLALVIGWMEPMVDNILNLKNICVDPPGGGRDPITGKYSGIPCKRAESRYIALPPLERLLFVVGLPSAFRFIVKTISGKIL